MALREAARRCPDAVFLASDHDAYNAASDEVMGTLRSFDVVVEVLGWDEAFLGTEVDEPVALAREVQERVLARTALTCAVGVGETKLQAKTATGFGKPGGIARIDRSSWMPTMGARPVTALHGIGTRTARRLASLDISTVAELADHDHRALAAAFGPTIGPSLKLTGMGGLPSRVVDEPHVPKSRSKEVTLEHDLDDPAAIEAQVRTLAFEVTASVVAEGRRVTHVAVKVRTRTFYTRTRISKLAEPTTDGAEVARVAAVVVGRFDIFQPVRLLGVRVVLEEPGATAPPPAP
jgi:DNA polymerase-4